MLRSSSPIKSLRVTLVTMEGMVLSVSSILSLDTWCGTTPVDAYTGGKEKTKHDGRKEIMVVGGRERKRNNRGRERESEREPWMVKLVHS